MSFPRSNDGVTAIYAKLMCGLCEDKTEGVCEIESEGERAKGSVTKQDILQSQNGP